MKERTEGEGRCYLCITHPHPSKNFLATVIFTSPLYLEFSVQKKTLNLGKYFKSIVFTSLFLKTELIIIIVIDNPIEFIHKKWNSSDTDRVRIAFQRTTIKHDIPPSIIIVDQTHSSH